MKSQTLWNKKGISGTLVIEDNGNQKLLSKTGKLLATYFKSNDKTYQNGNGDICTGNQVMRFLED
jgi:hypothetical protein